MYNKIMTNIAMKIIIRLPCEQEITVEIENNDTILALKEQICLKERLINERFTLHVPGQEQPLANHILLSSFSAPFLQLIHDTLDKSKIMDMILPNKTDHVNHYLLDDSLTIEQLVQKPTPTINLYASSLSPVKPNVPSVPKASYRKKPEQRYDDDDDDGCVLL
jgi:hypothetical protein